MKPTTDEVLAWAREAWVVDEAKPLHESTLPPIKQLAALAYAAGAEAMKERCVDAVPPQYFELRDRIRALGDDE